MIEVKFKKRMNRKRSSSCAEGKGLYTLYPQSGDVKETPVHELKLIDDMAVHKNIPPYLIISIQLASVYRKVYLLSIE